jgi:amidase
MFDEEFISHFTLIIGADTETSMRAFETALGRPIEDDEIEPRNAVYRAIGRTLEVVTYLQSRAWLGTWACHCTGRQPACQLACNSSRPSAGRIC